MPKKTEYNKKMKQLTIMQAAEEIFLKRPYSVITVNEIAGRAGVTKKTLYSYFPSKLALFIRMFEDYLQRLHKQYVNITQTDLSPVEKFFRILQMQFEFNQENQAFMRLFWTLDSDEFDGELPEELIQSIRLWNRELINMAIGVVEEGQREGSIGPCSPEMLVHFISAFNKGIVLHVNKEAKFNIANVEVQDLQNMFSDFLKKGLNAVISPTKSNLLAG